jgi:hypothetical protein
VLFIAVGGASVVDGVRVELQTNVRVVADSFAFVKIEIVSSLLRILLHNRFSSGRRDDGKVGVCSSEQV